MAYAVANRLVLAGLLLLATFASGIIVTVVVFMLTAIVFHSRIVGMLDRSDGLRRRIGFLLEVAAASVVTALSLWPLIAR